MHLLAFIGGWEWIIVAFVGLLIFGRRLPSVARNIGSSYNQFRAGLKDEVALPNKSLDSGKDTSQNEASDKEDNSSSNS